MKNQRSHTHHGEGSVFHLTTPNRRKSWVAQVTLGGGKKKHVYCTSQKEANTARRQMLHEVEHAMVVEGSQQTVAAYFKQWLATKRLELKNSTYETYRKYTAWFILPALATSACRS